MNPLKLAALCAVVALAACNKSEPTVIAVPVPVAVPGPAGPAGETGAKGTDGKPGESSTVIVMPPAASAATN